MPGGWRQPPRTIGVRTDLTGYVRLANTDHIHQVVYPVLDAIETNGNPPEWAGLDLLRGAMFVLQRNMHWTDDPSGQLEQHMRVLLRAIRQAAPEGQLMVDYFPG